MVSLDYLPWILFAIAVARLVAAGRHVAEARAELQRVGDRLHAAMRLLDERSIEAAGATPRVARVAAPVRRRPAKALAPAL